MSSAWKIVVSTRPGSGSIPTLTKEAFKFSSKFSSKYFIVRCNHNNYKDFFLRSHLLCHINSLVKLNTLKTEAGITRKEQLPKTYIIVFSVLYSVTTHSYSKIFNTKINKWVWGTFGISACIQLNITHTLVIHWL